MTTPPPLSGGTRKPSMSPAVWSALVYPGVGQLVQRRWIAASVFIVIFSLALGWFVTRAVQVLAAYYDLAFDFEHADGVAPRASGIVLPFLVSMAIYLAGIVDAAIRRRGGPAS